MNGPGLVKSPKRGWKAKTRSDGSRCIGVLGVPGKSSATAPLLDPMVLKVAQTISPITGDSFGCVGNVAVTGGEKG